LSEDTAIYSGEVTIPGNGTQSVELTFVDHIDPYISDNSITVSAGTYYAAVLINYTTTVTESSFTYPGGTDDGGGGGDGGGAAIPTEGLVAEYLFSGSADDTSGNGNDGTVNGAALTTDRFGNTDKAYSFDGTGDYIDCGNDSSLDITEFITMSCWFLVDSTEKYDDTPTIISKHEAAGYGIYVASNNPVCQVNLHVDGGWRVVESNNTVNEEEWIHAVGVFDGSTIKLYINNVLQDDAYNISSTISSSSVNLVIGANPTGSGIDSNKAFHGKIDDVRIYNRALTTSEIDALYNETADGSGNYSPITPVKHIVDDSVNGPWGLDAVDIDEDSDIDILGAVYAGDGFAWWENDGSGNYTRHDLLTNIDCANTAEGVDLDNDGDLDILACASGTVDKILWFENDGEENFTQHDIASAFDGTINGTACDIDEDGDLDVLAAASGADEIAWWENDGAESFTKHVIADTLDAPVSLSIIDLDEDNDYDIVAGALFSDMVIWYENDGAQSFTGHTIDDSFDGTRAVAVSDIDSDSDFDVLAAAAEGNELAWWENDGTELFTKHVITTDLIEPYHIVCSDINDDGKDDIVAACKNGNGIYWWANQGAGAFTKYTVDDAFNGAVRVEVEDVNQDGTLDVLGAAAGDDEIAWWEIVQ
jgi:hypothetical protein